MGVVVNVTEQDIRGMLEAYLTNVDNAILSALAYVGEECVNEARDNGSYTDRTGNLRSSIGYIVLKNGERMIQGGNAQYQGKYGDGHEGVEGANALLQRLQGEYPQGYVLIVVAGMNYAVYVEEKYHKNVLQSAELLAEKEVPRFMKTLGLR